MPLFPFHHRQPERFEGLNAEVAWSRQTSLQVGQFVTTLVFDCCSRCWCWHNKKSLSQRIILSSANRWIAVHHPFQLGKHLLQTLGHLDCCLCCGNELWIEVGNEAQLSGIPNVVCPVMLVSKARAFAKELRDLAGEQLYLFSMGVLSFEYDGW